MIRAMTIFAATATIVALSGCERTAVSQPNCTVTDFGITGDTEIERRKFAPTSPSLALDELEDFPFVEQTDRIPLVLGTVFGFDYTVENLPPGTRLDFITRHPPMDVPGRGIITDFTINQEPSESFGYGFDYDFELVEGEWAFELVMEGQLLCAQRFETHHPDAD